MLTAALTFSWNRGATEIASCKLMRLWLKVGRILWCAPNLTYNLHTNSHAYTPSKPQNLRGKTVMSTVRTNIFGAESQQLNMYLTPYALLPSKEKKTNIHTHTIYLVYPLNSDFKIKNIDYMMSIHYKLF